MPGTLFPAFEAALENNDKETLRKLYALEHSWRTRAEAQVQALLWKEAHGPSGKAAQPGYLATGVSIRPAASENYTITNIEPKSSPATLSSSDIPI